MALSIPAKAVGPIVFTAQEDTIRFSGEIDHADPSEFLAPFFGDVVTQASGSGMSQIKIDIRELKFINSSGVKSFVLFLVKMMGLPENKRFKVDFVHDPGVTWQRAILSPLMVLAPNYVRVV